MNAHGILRAPGDLKFGLGARQAIAPAAVQFGSDAIVIVDPFLRQTPEFLQVVDELHGAGISTTLYDEVVPELPVDSVTAAAEALRGSNPDVVIGYGGGSALDLAKLVALLLRHEGPLSRYYGENKVPGPVVPLIAVPTTAGTGSEATPVAVISDPSRELKVGISDPALIPAVAVVDPQLTVGAPAGVTAWSGIDALVHAIEGVTAESRTPGWGQRLPVFVGRNRLSTLLAMEAIVAIDGSLAKAVSEPTDLDARQEMAWGSLLAGMAFGSSGTHLSHALQYPIGALTHTPHGLGTGMMLPYVLEACLETSVEPLNDISDALGMVGERGEARARRCIDRIAALVVEIGIPASLEEIGIQRDQLSGIADLALGVERLVNNSTVAVTHEVLMRILEAAFAGDRTALRQ